MKLTKLFTFLCLIPALVGCEQTAVSIESSQKKEKAQLVVFGYTELSDKKMSDEEFSKLKELGKSENIVYSNNRYDVTPKELKGICTLYAKDLMMIDVLVYQGEVYTVRMNNTHGFTRLAYYNNGEKEALYYSRDNGSGRHILQIGAFNFKLKQDMAVDIGLNDRGQMHDYAGAAFEKSRPCVEGYDKDTLAVREMKYNKESPEEQPYILDDGFLYDDLTTYQFVSWENKLQK